MSASRKRTIGVLSLATFFCFLCVVFIGDSGARSSATFAPQEQSKSAEQLLSEANQNIATGSPEAISKGIDLLSRAVELYRKANDRSGEGVVMGNIGLLYNSLGDVDRALDVYDQSLKIFTAIGDRNGEARVLNNIGRVYQSRGDTAKATERYQQALVIWQAQKNAPGEASTLNNLASTYEARGDYKTALETYARALMLRETISDRRGQAATLNNIGYLNAQHGDTEAALAAYQRALAIWQALNDRDGSATTLENLASLYESRGDKQKAGEFAARGAALRTKMRTERKPVLHILAIGNDHYPFGPRRTQPNMKYPIWNLTTAVNDARQFSTALEKASRGFERVSTTLVINAKRAEILSAFDKVIHEIKPEDTFIFSYSGQGFSVPVERNKREFYLMPTDFTARAGIPGAISATLLRALFTKIQARHRLIVLDARDSSEGFDSLVSAMTEENKSLGGLLQRDVALVTISEGPRVSLIQGEGSGNGLLTYALLKGLRESATPSGLTVRQLVQYASEYVKQRLPTIPNLNDYQRHGEVRSFFAGDDFPLIHGAAESGRAYAHRLSKPVTVLPQQAQVPAGGIEGRTDTTLARAPALRRGRDFALLIASNTYDEWTPLANPIPDAEEIEKELKNYYGFETQLVRNPTKAEIVTVLKKYKNEMKYGEDDQLFIFIAGHGDFSDDFREGYIIAKNSLKVDPEVSTYISHSQLRNIIDQIPCRHIFLVIDACFGGTFDESIVRGKNPYADATNREFIYRKMQFVTRRFLTSGGKDYVPDGEPGHNSPFVFRFLEALRSYGDNDGILTITRILSYVERVTPEPRYGGWGQNQPGSDFVFVAKPK